MGFLKLQITTPRGSGNIRSRFKTGDVFSGFSSPARETTIGIRDKRASGQAGFPDGGEEASRRYRVTIQRMAVTIVQDEDSNK
jgi:hypothetical protein